MPANPAMGAHSTATDDLGALVASWRRSLAARRISSRTIATYATSVDQLAGFLAERGMPTAVASVRREHVEAFIADLLERRAPGTAHNRFRGCQAFFVWAVEEGEVRESPMMHMKPPRLPEAPPPVLRDDALRAILAAAERDKTYDGRRDEAILRVLMDTGARRAEVLGLRRVDVDLDTGMLVVTGKGSRTRRVVVGATTIRALDRYIRARAKRPDAATGWLWLGRKGQLRETGLAQLIRERAREAGVAGRVTPHSFRHSYAHAMLAAGMQESDLMAVTGWRSRDMLTRYAASTRAERALKTARELSPVDRLAEPRR